MRFSNVLWYDGEPYHLLLQAVNDRGRASVIQNVWPNDQLFSMKLAKKTTFRQTRIFLRMAVEHSARGDSIAR